MERRRRTDAHQYRLDYESRYEEDMALLRAHFDKVDYESLELSEHRWRLIRELLLAVRAHGERYCIKATAEVMRTAGLTRKQFYAARATALELGILENRRRWRSHRQSDVLTLRRDAIDALALRPPEGNRGKLRGTEGNQGELPERSLNPKILKSLNPNPQQRDAPRRTREHANAADWGSVVVEIFSCEVQQATKAVETLRTHGASPADARAILEAWRDRCERWPVEFRPVVLYRRLMFWRPGQDPGANWPAAASGGSERIAQARRVGAVTR